MRKISNFIRRLHSCTDIDSSYLLLPRCTATGLSWSPSATTTPTGPSSTVPGTRSSWRTLDMIWRSSGVPITKPTPLLKISGNYCFNISAVPWRIPVEATSSVKSTWSKWSSNSWKASVISPAKKPEPWHSPLSQLYAEFVTMQPVRTAHWVSTRTRARDRSTSVHNSQLATSSRYYCSGVLVAKTKNKTVVFT